MSVEAFSPEAADERVVGRFAAPRDVQRDAALIRPPVKFARHELTAVIDAERYRESHFLPGSFQHLHDIGAAEGKPWRQSCSISSWSDSRDPDP